MIRGTLLDVALYVFGLPAFQLTYERPFNPLCPQITSVVMNRNSFVIAQSVQDLSLKTTWDLNAPSARLFIGSTSGLMTNMNNQSNPLLILPKKF
jgi:hypothetical protein